MATNTTAAWSAYDVPPLPAYTLEPLPPLIPGLPDQYLVQLSTFTAYWAVSLFFHIIDIYDLFPHYRLHTPAEVLKRNHVSRWEVFRDVVVQQGVQFVTAMVLAYVEGPPMHGSQEYDVAVWAQRIRLLQRAIPSILSVVGVDYIRLAKSISAEHALLAGVLKGGIYPELTQTVLLAGERTTAPAFAGWEMLAAKVIYHFLIPAIQFTVAICAMDTWQYFVHRGMHVNKYLYTTLHSRHHRLYVPYAYGALYNHPIEGFFMDTVGAGFAYVITGMTVRQSMWLFTSATIKTVDDHCGYKFPWDPLQHVSSNNAAYHDIHHQSWGIKTNFSQPFLTFWDSFLGTKWTGGDVSSRYERARLAAQKKVDADAIPVTGSSPEESISATTTLPYDARVPSSIARTAHTVSEPQIPPGKATYQALSSRQQVLDDVQGGGISVLAEESAEEIREQKATRRSPRKRTASFGLKGFADRVGESLQGRGTGVLGVESGR
jgi:sphinganine C4-monooxygenase